MSGKGSILKDKLLFLYQTMPCVYLLKLSLHNSNEYPKNMFRYLGMAIPMSTVRNVLVLEYKKNLNYHLKYHVVWTIYFIHPKCWNTLVSYHT